MKTLVICGSRGWSDYKKFKAKLDHLTSKLEKVVLITGDAKSGADSMCSRWSRDVFPKCAYFKVYHADWDKLGKGAGPARNTKMLEEAGKKAVVVAFWDGKSKGTAGAVAKARKRGMKVIVVRI